jgi:hypothetical protein
MTRNNYVVKSSHSDIDRDRESARSLIITPHLKNPIEFESRDGTYFKLRFDVELAVYAGDNEYRITNHRYLGETRWVLTAYFSFGNDINNTSEIIVGTGRTAYTKGMKHFKDAIKAYDTGNIKIHDIRNTSVSS